jgi:hypothetical protein
MGGVKRLVALASLLGALWAAPVTDASAAYWRHCGSQPQIGYGWYHVRAHKIGCPKARDVARRYAFAGDETPLRFQCGDNRIGYELVAVRCGRGSGEDRQRVAFQVGA